MLSGDNSILQKTTQSKEKTERAEIIENAQMDILAKITDKKGETITENELVEILTSADYSTQGELSDEESILDRTLTSKDGKHEILVSEIYNGNLATEDNIERTIIIFSLDGAPVQAYEGMTFGEWVTSSFNGIGCYIADKGFGEMVFKANGNAFYIDDPYFVPNGTTVINAGDNYFADIT